MKKIIFAGMMIALLTTALATTGLAMSQAWGKGPGMGMGYGGPHSGGPGLWRSLNLTPEQSEKMRALRKSFFEQILPLRNELRSKRFELKALWVQTNPDEGKILDKQKEINALRAQIQEKATKNRLEMRKILTPEQQAMLINLRAEQWHRYHEYGGRCGSAPGPRHGTGMGYGPRW